MSTSEFFPTGTRLHKSARRIELSQQRASAAASKVFDEQQTKAKEEEQFRLTVVWNRNGGYRDGFTGQAANPPAWGTIPEWSNAYAEGYALGMVAAKKIKRHIGQQKELEL